MQCNFEMKSWANMGNVYTCSVNDLNVVNNGERVNSIEGSHMEGKSNADVIKLNIDNASCKYLPQGFEVFFPNLKGLRVAASGLEYLKQSDLSAFPKLINCDMFNNHLKTLGDDLFSKNLDLEYLYFGDNQINNVGYNIFEALSNLHTAVFQGNQCIRSNAYSADEIITLQKKLNELCSVRETDKSDYESETFFESSEYGEVTNVSEDISEETINLDEVKGSGNSIFSQKFADTRFIVITNILIIVFASLK